MVQNAVTAPQEDHVVWSDQFWNILLEKFNVSEINAFHEKLGWDKSNRWTAILNDPRKARLSEIKYIARLLQRDPIDLIMSCRLGWNYITLDEAAAMAKESDDNQDIGLVTYPA